MASMACRTRVAREGRIRQTGVFGCAPWTGRELARGGACLDRNVGRGPVLGASAIAAHGLEVVDARLVARPADKTRVWLPPARAAAPAARAWAV